MAFQVVSPDELQRHLGTKLGVEDTAFVASLEKAAVAWFERETNRTLADSGTITEYRNGNGQEELPLFNDASAVASASYWDGDSWDAVTATDYAIYDGNKLTRLDSGVWAVGVRNIQIIYTGGYDDGLVPEDIALAIAGWIANEWRRARGSDDVTEGVPPWVKELIDPWVVRDSYPVTPFQRA